MNRRTSCLTLFAPFAAGLMFSMPAEAGEPRLAVIIHAEKPVAHIHARRAVTSARRFSLRYGDKLALMTDCRNAKGTVVVGRWEKAFGKRGGNPKSVQGLWCDVGYRVPSSQAFVRGWLQGKYLEVLPAE